MFRLIYTSMETSTFTGQWHRE